MPYVRYSNLASRKRGFTIIELAIVIVILAVLSAIALPRVAHSIEIHRADTAAQRVLRDLHLARELAQAQSAALTVQFDVANNAYTLNGQNHLDHADQAYTVLLSNNPFRAEIIQADFGGDTTVELDGYGMPDTGGTVTIRAGRRTVTVELDADTGLATITSSGG